MGDTFLLLPHRLAPWALLFTLIHTLRQRREGSSEQKGEVTYLTEGLGRTSAYVAFFFGTGCLQKSHVLSCVRDWVEKFGFGLKHWEALFAKHLSHVL